MDNPLSLLLVLGSGLIAGFVNTLAGGGSLLTVPILITIVGLPSNIANATNRVALIFQNVSAIRGFQSKGISAYPYSLYLGIAAIPGALLGAELAIDIRAEIFNRILAVIMVIVVIFTIVQRQTKQNDEPEKLGFKHQLIGVIIFFFLGVYGGFIQAGIGFLAMIVFTTLNNFSLVKSNSAKVFTVLIYSLPTVILFAIRGKIDWTYGLTLAFGNATGAWIGSRWSVDKGDVWVKRFLTVAVIALAIKLWFF